MAKHITAICIYLCLSMYADSLLYAQETSGEWEQLAFADMTINAMCVKDDRLIVGLGEETQNTYSFKYGLQDGSETPYTSLIDTQSILDLTCGSPLHVFAGTHVGLFRSAADTTIWVQFKDIRDDTAKADQVISVVADPTEPYMFVGDSRGNIFRKERSNNLLMRWGKPSSVDVNALVLPRNPSKTVFAGISTTLYSKSTEDNDDSWEEAAVFDKVIVDVQIADYADSTVFYVIQRSKLLKSIGPIEENQWEVLYETEDATMEISAVAPHPIHAQTIFIGTEQGVKKTNSDGKSWEDLDPTNFPDKNVNSLSISADIYDFVYAGLAEGNGLWGYRNDPPDSLLLQEPSPEAIQSSLDVEFVWNSDSLDAEKDSLYYTLEVARDANFTDQVERIHSVEHPDRFTPQLPWTGTSPVSVGVTLPGGGAYFWRISATDGIDDVISETRSFIVDTTPPRIDISSSEERSPAQKPAELLGTDYTFDFDISDDSFSQIQRVTQYYYMGGNSRWYTEELIGNDGTYTVEILGDSIGIEGVAYFIEAVDIAGNTARLPEEDRYYSIPIEFESNRVASPDSIQDRVHQLVSIPLNLDNKVVDTVLFEELGFYDRARYRVIDWDAEREDYVDYAENRNFRFLSGKGYWLIAKGDPRVLTVGSGETTPLELHTLSVKAGWNIVANPFAFPICANQFSLSDGSSIDGFIDPVQDKVNQLDPWKAYFLEVPGSSDLELIADPGLPEPGAFLTGGCDEPNSDEVDANTIRILARNGLNLDEDNYLGFSTSDSAAVDLSRSMPPPITAGFEVYFHNPAYSWPYLTAEYKMLQEKAQSWQIVVDNIDPTASTVLSFDNLNLLRETFDIRLFDEDTNTSYDLNSQSEIELHASSIETRRKTLTLLIGESSFIRQELHAIEEGARRTALLQNYPNPFSDRTTLQLTLAAPSPVRITIYNILGQTVATLVNASNYDAGTYSLQWDGTDRRGMPVPSGFYHAVMHTDTEKRSINMVIVR